MPTPSGSNVYVPNVYMPPPMHSVHNIDHNVFVQPSPNRMNQFAPNIFMPTPMHSSNQSESYSFLERAFRPSSHVSNPEDSMRFAEESSQPLTPSYSTPPTHNDDIYKHDRG